MIGIICAMPEEVDGFLRGTSGQPTELDGYCRVEVGGFDAVIASSGLGKVHAAMKATTLLQRYDCRILVSAGTAGGLEGAQPMQVIVGSALIQHDYGRSRGHGELELYPPGVPPLPEFRTDDFALRVPAETLARLKAATDGLEQVRFGTFASGDTFVNDQDTRQRLIDLGALAVDMECASVAQVAEHHAAPWLVAKGISDSASDQSHEDFLEGLKEASRLSAEVVATLLPAMQVDDA